MCALIINHEAQYFWTKRAFRKQAEGYESKASTISPRCRRLRPGARALSTPRRKELRPGVAAAQRASLGAGAMSRPLKPTRHEPSMKTFLCPICCPIKSCSSSPACLGPSGIALILHM